MMIERLLPGETYEVGNVYVGDQGFVCATRSVSSNRKQLRERRKNKRKTKEKGNRIRRKVEYYLG